MEYSDLISVLLENNLTISAMESLTGGLFASTITSIPNASKVFVGSAITYVDSCKEKYGVSSTTINEYGAVSKECAKEMAIQAQLFFNSDISISFTGNAGPTGSEDKPVGLVYVAINYNKKLDVYQLNLVGDRNSIRKQCVDFGFIKIIELLKNISNNQDEDDNILVEEENNGEKEFSY